MAIPKPKSADIAARDLLPIALMVAGFDVECQRSGPKYREKKMRDNEEMCRTFRATRFADDLLPTAYNPEHI